MCLVVHPKNRPKKAEFQGRSVMWKIVAGGRTLMLSAKPARMSVKIKEFFFFQHLVSFYWKSPRFLRLGCCRKRQIVELYTWEWPTPSRRKAMLNAARTAAKRWTSLWAENVSSFCRWTWTPDHYVEKAETNGACAHYVMVSKFQWKPFCLPASEIHRMTGPPSQNRVNYDVLAQAPYPGADVTPRVFLCTYDCDCVRTQVKSLAHSRPLFECGFVLVARDRHRLLVRSTLGTTPGPFVFVRTFRSVEVANFYMFIKSWVLGMYEQACVVLTVDQ